MNYIHLSKREKQIWCVQESQPRHGLKAFAIFLIGPILFCNYLLSFLHPIPLCLKLLISWRGRQAAEPACCCSQGFFRCMMVKAGRKGMLALGLAAKGTCFSTCLLRLGDLDFFLVFCILGKSPKMLVSCGRNSWLRLHCPYASHWGAEVHGCFQPLWVTRLPDPLN